MSETPARRRRAPARGARPPALPTAAVGLLVLAALAALAAGATPLLVCGVATAALMVVGVLVHRQTNAWLWLLVAAVMATWGVGRLAQAHDALVAQQVCDALCLVMAGVLVVVVMRWVARARRRPDLFDAVTVLVVVVLAVVQVAQLLGEERPVAALASVQVVITAFLGRLALSRRRLQPAWVTLLLGAVLMSTGGLAEPLAAGAGVWPALALGAGCVLFAVAALLPSSRSALVAEALVERAAGSKVVLAALPLVLAPAGLWAVDRQLGTGALPEALHIAVGTLSAATAVLRAFAATRRLEHQAEHDPLTDLRNRRGLARVHDRAEHPWALLLVDLDDFKDVNDSYGHDAGDQLLLVVRARLLAAVADDGVVARFGGDEFAVLVHPGREVAVAERVVAAMRASVVVDGAGGVSVRCTASVGVTPPVPGLGLSELLTRADVALYAAKGDGRDRARVYAPQQREAVVERLTLTSQVRQLLGGRSPAVGRLEMHYQPLVELRTGEVVGAEALVRWRHPEQGLLAPDAFLGHVATTGLDAELDAAVLAEVLEQMGRWRDQRRRVLPVSVNLTRSSLLDPALADRVADGLARAGVPGRQLRVEITEHEPLPDDDGLAATLQRLRGLGVEVHLDDYGTGYTSLDYLERFPVTLLKVDRSVVQALPGRSQVVAGLAALSRTMRLDVLAEGVETPEQRARLVELGVRYGQGWLFSRPLAAADYAAGVLGDPPAAPSVPPVPAPRLPLAVAPGAPVVGRPDGDRAGAGMI